MYAIRQTIVRHIIAIGPDVSQLFHDEEGYKKAICIGFGYADGLIKN